MVEIRQQRHGHDGGRHDFRVFAWKWKDCDSKVPGKIQKPRRQKMVGGVVARCGWFTWLGLVLEKMPIAWVVMSFQTWHHCGDWFFVSDYSSVSEVSANICMCQQESARVSNFSQVSTSVYKCQQNSILFSLKIKLFGERGCIYDRTGLLLAHACPKNRWANYCWN